MHTSGDKLDLLRQRFFDQITKDLISLHHVIERPEFTHDAAYIQATITSLCTSLAVLAISDQASSHNFGKMFKQ